jgi:hypothetical protein
MGAIALRLATILVLVEIAALSAPSPAVAIDAALAKKCRSMAIKAHPPQLPGSKPYARAERDFFRECVAKKGDMPESNQEQGPDSAPPKSSPK